VTISNNDINVIVGAGIFGLRLGFSEYIRSVQNYTDAPYWAFEDSLESSLKPSLELGFKIPAGKVTIKPSLWGAFDIHGYKSETGYLFNDFAVANSPQTYWAIQNDEINFMEPSGGLTIAVELGLSDTSSMEFALYGDGALRLYRDKEDPDPISSALKYGNASAGFPVLPLFLSTKSTATAYEYLLASGDFYATTPGATDTVSLPSGVVIPMDLQGTGGLSFAYTGDITERVTLGVKIAIDGGFGLQTIDVEDPSGTVLRSDSVMTISGAPDLALGASFHLIPDHFSLHAGLGVQLFSFERSVLTPEAGGVAGDETTTTTFGLPQARFGGGLTVNLTEAIALDAMAFSSGLDYDSTAFTLILTVKK
jgi:hypothetical protein